MRKSHTIQISKKMSEFDKLTGNQKRILNVLKHLKVYSNRRLSEITGMDTAHMTRYLKFLESNGWVEKFQCVQCCHTILWKRIK
ncbi:transcriptional regulator MarR family [Nitrososphaeria virus YSH_1032793]|uniref:Transcriptional regulator MarR family n=1 Tax=Nitrososphaeria virus YSH_1032793 TaxID=3071320 RepID=A0A976UAD8_9CAUD|nr:transcriptional regulator MarR family [Yangshan Harbor Nitrososphaeria virus]UVF62264.1 transcriptional regulator MarR family [Nitrososphaeria virus YSH_1032793]